MTPTNRNQIVSGSVPALTILSVLLTSGCSDAAPSPTAGSGSQVVGQGTAGVPAAGRTGTNVAGSSTPSSSAGVTATTAGRAAPTTGAAGTAVAGSTSPGATAAGANAAGAGDSGTGATAGDSGSAAGGSNASGTGGDSAATAGATAAAGSGGASPNPGVVEPDQPGPYEVQLDQPVGEGFGVPIASSDVGDGVAGCKTFAESFGSDPMATMDLIKLPPDLRMDLYSLYRPAVLEEGKKYPLITWGNGTCAKPEGYRTLLRHVASHGFFVVAANSRQVGQNSPMTKALDWATAANKDPMSPYYGKIDLDKIGAMGHSQGGAATVSAARDSRVKTVILWNGGSSATKPFLAVSGDRDGANSLPGYKRATGNAPKGAYLWYHMIPGDGPYDGHLTLMVEPERVVGPATAWFRFILQDDPISKPWFVGADCKLCKTPDSFEFGQNGLE